MNNFDEKDALSRELHDRSQDIDGHPIAIESVKQRARRIQRRRWIAGSAVAAVVLAIAVPTALSVTTGSNRGAEPVGPNPTPNPSPTATQSATPRPDGPVLLTTEGIPRGEDPKVSFFRWPRLGGPPELVTPDGGRQLPVSLQGIAPYGDGWIGLGYDSRGAEMFILDSDLRSIIDRFPTGNSFAVSSDGGQVAYVRIAEDKSQRLVNAPTSGTGAVTWSFPAGPAITPVGFVDADSVLYQGDGVKPPVGLAKPGGEIVELEGFIKVTGANMENGLVAGQTRSNPDASGCFGVMDPTISTSEMLWDTCDYSLSTFSPNGQFVLASDAYLDGIGTGSVSILDAQTGELVVTYEQQGKSQIALTQTVWESNDTVLAIAADGLSFTILRMSTAGDLEAATDALENDPNADIPYWFATPN